MSVQNTPQNGGNKKINTAKQSSLNSWMWMMLMANVVFVLVLMTLGIMALKVGNALPNGVDILYVVGRDPSFENIDDDGKVWTNDTQVDIFSANHVNGEGVTTVVSQDGTKVIAPGTVSTYRFGAYNNGNMAIMYQTDVDFTFRLAGEEQEQYEFPLSVRLRTEQGKYLIGGENRWIPVDEAVATNHVSVLGAGCYEEFILELLWAFEGGNDELDTMYGNMAVEGGVELTFGINTYAEEHIDPSAKGGTPINPEANNDKQEYGGEARWFWLILLMVNTGILIFYLSFLITRRMQKNNENK